MTLKGEMMEQLIYDNKPKILIALSLYSFFAIGGTLATASSSVLIMIAAFIFYSRSQNNKLLTTKKYPKNYLRIK